MAETIRILLLSSLFPSSVRPIHGIFVETRLRELVKTGRVVAKVVAPVPWFPFTGARFGEYSHFARTPRFENRNGMDVYHPRYFLPPKVGMNVAPYAMALGALATIKKIQRAGFNFDLIDAHYYYPDGVAASMLSAWLGKPLAITARGTDINLISQFARPRRLILQAGQRANASIGVSQALADKLGEIGIEKSKLHTLRNGVDLQRFSPEPRDIARQKLGLPAEVRILLSVGNLIELKGHHIAIDALPSLPADAMLFIAGRGPDQSALQLRAENLGVGERVKFVGVVQQENLKWWYSAADALLLCSSREGWANVLLESMACGTPVIATNISGTADVVKSNAAGVLMTERSAQAIAAAWTKLMENYPRREDTRNYAESFSWDATTQGIIDLFQTICD